MMIPRASLKRHLIALAVVVNGGCQSASSGGPVSLCEISAHPAAYVDGLVQSRVNVMSDGHHGVSIFDPQCENRGMVLLIPVELRGQADISELRETIFAVGGGGTLGRTVTATLTGNRDAPSRPGGSYAFSLTHARNIEVKLYSLLPKQ